MSTLTLDQIAGFLRGHNAGKPGDAKDVAFFGFTGDRERQRFWRHHDPSARARQTLCVGLVRDIDHMRLAGGCDMRE
jgi:hypothetical protein